MRKLKKGQVFGIFKYSFNSETFINRMICTPGEAKKYVAEVGAIAELKPVGAFIITSIKSDKFADDVLSNLFRS